MFALSWGADDLTQMHGRVIVDFAAEHRFPAIYASREFADADGLMTYGGSDPRSPATLPSSSPPQFRSALATARKKKESGGSAGPPLSREWVFCLYRFAS